MKPQVKHLFFLALIAVVLTVAARPIPPQSPPVIEEVAGLPATMNVGDSFTVEIQVTSETTFISAAAMPSAFFPGRYVVSPGGVDLVRNDTSSTLYITFTAKDSTAGLPDGAPVSVFVGVRYPGGVLITEHFDYYVTVP